MVDHDADAMDLTLRLNAGPPVRFGAIEVAGLEQVQADFVERRLPWRAGELITAERLEAGQRALRETNLFSTIGTRLGETPDAAGRLPVTVVVTERKHRSIEAGVRYQTDEGPGGNIAWEHRNFFGRGERVRAELDASCHRRVSHRQLPQAGRLDPGSGADHRSAARLREPDAYESQSARARVGLERQFREGMTLAGGVAFRAEQVEEANSGREETFGLVLAAAAVQMGSQRRPPRPDSSGGRLSLDNEPFVDTFGNDLVFNKSKLEYSHYLEVWETPRVVLAGRSAIGTLFGAARADVPANLRFYAGGGGSVRGFAYQTAGELDEEHDPIGGRSLFEVSGEVRVRVTETIGVVAFVDAGTAFSFDRSRLRRRAPDRGRTGHPLFQSDRAIPHRRRLPGEPSRFRRCLPAVHQPRPSFLSPRIAISGCTTVTNSSHWMPKKLAAAPCTVHNRR